MEGLGILSSISPSPAGTPPPAEGRCGREEPPLSQQADRYSSYSMSQRSCPEWNLASSHAAEVQTKGAGRGGGGATRMEIER